MNALLAAAVLGATVFVEQDLPGLEIGTSQFPISIVPSNVETADVNRDGQTDLVLSGTVRLRIAGRFPDSGRIRMPENGDFETTHVEGDLFFGFSAGRLVCYRLSGGAWSLFWEVTLPPEDMTDAAPFFQDIDGDGRSEMLMAGASRIRVFRLARGVQAAGELDVYPPRRPEEDWARDLWQSRGRAQAPASAERRFRLEFAPPGLRVHELLSGGPNRMEHRIVEYRIVAGFGDFDVAEVARSTRSGIPAFMAPCHLDAGDIVDYAGIRPAPSPTVPWTTPVNDVVLSVDDREPQTIRTKALEAAISIADFDADGDADLIVEWNDYLDGPPREVMLSLASRKRFNHTIAVYVQEVGGSFSRRARELLTVPMRFDAPLSDGGRRWNEYRSGGLTSTQGDFNGDKRADVAVWFAPSRIAIHMNHEGLYHREADVELTVPDGFARMAAVDIDGDGKSDLVLVPASAETAPKVFFSR